MIDYDKTVQDALDFVESLGITNFDYFVDIYKQETEYKYDLVPEIIPHFYPTGLHMPTVNRETDYTGDHTIKNRLLNPSETDIIAWNEIDHKYYHFRNPDKLLSYLLAIPVADRTYHERIYGDQPQKLRLDIDYKYGIDGNRVEEFTDTDLRAIYETMTNTLATMFDITLFNTHDDIIICKSTGTYVEEGQIRTKFSHHIIVDGYYTISYIVAKKFAEVVKNSLIKQGHIELSKAIDMQIYKTATGLRLPYNHKQHSDRIKLLPSGKKFNRALITNVTDCYELKLRTEYQVAKQIDIPTVNIIDTDINVIIEAINKYNPLILEGFTFRSSNNRYLNFYRTKPSQCVFCEEIHHKDNTIFVIVDSGFAMIKCRHKTNEYLSIPIVIETPIPVVKKTTLEQMIERRLKSEARINKPCKKRCNNIEDVKFIEKEIYEGVYNAVTGHSMNEYPVDISTLFIKAPMGSGKTKETVDFIERINITKLLAAGFRKTFIVKLVGDLRLVSYLDIVGPISPDNHPKVAVQVESFHRLVARPYEVLVLDEIESILAQCFAPTHKKAAECWAKFEYLVKYCERVICIDANLKESTIKLITDMRAGKSSKLIINKLLPKKTTHHITTIKSIAVNKLLTLLLAGKKVVVPTSSRKTAECIAAMVKQKFPTKKIKLYTSETDPGEKERDIADIENAWKDCDVLIYTPTIQAGVSFTGKHFDACISFWYNTSTDVYSCLQMMMRVRDIADLDYTHYVKERIGDRPDTPERVLKFASESCENLAKCYGINLEYTIQEDGKLEIKSDNYRTRAWLQHIADQNLSKNNFLGMLREELVILNGTIVAEQCSTKDLIDKGKNLNDQMKIIDVKLITSEYQKIIKCNDITRERYEELKDSDKITPDEKYMIKRHLIRKFYSLPDDKLITLEFLNTYWDPKIRSQYAHRKNIHGFEGIRTTIDNISQITVDSFFYGSSTEKFEKLFAIVRDKYCLEFLDMFGFSFDNPTKIITGTELIEILRVNHDKIASTYDSVRKAFECRKSKPPKIGDEGYVLNMLRHINGKLNAQYGINIVATDKHNDTYKIEDNFATLFDANFKPIK